MVKAENIFKVTLNSAFIRKTMTFLSKCLSLMLTQTPCHKAAQCTSSGLIKAEHTEYRGTESQVYCFHSDIKFFFLCSSPVKWKKAQLHNEMIIIWPGFFFFFLNTHIWRCAVFPHHFLEVWGGGSCFKECSRANRWRRHWTRQQRCAHYCKCKETC